MQRIYRSDQRAGVTEVMRGGTEFEAAHRERSTIHVRASRLRRVDQGAAPNRSVLRASTHPSLCRNSYRLD